MRNLTLVEWILLVVLALTGLTIALPAMARANRYDKLAGCRDRLKTMFQASQAAPPAPDALGSAYWTRLNLPAGTLRCPFIPEEHPRTCDYLGPSSDPVALGPQAPLGCDFADNHGEHGREGGNVLYKSGEVKTLFPIEAGNWVDPWREATHHKCRP